MNIVRTNRAPRKGQVEFLHQELPSSRELGLCPVAGTAAGSLSSPVVAAPFLIPVPDYIMGDWLIAKPRPRPSTITGRTKPGRRRIGGLHWAIHQVVIVQKTSRVVLADVVLAQVFWGGDRRRWPRNWRGQLVRRLKRMATLKAGLSKVVHREADLGEHGCPAACMLHGSQVRHQHLEISIATPAEDFAAESDGEPEYSGAFLGALEAFGIADYPDRTYHWNPRPLPDEDAEEEYAGDREEHKLLLANIKSLKRSGRLAAVYFPLNLFGPSPRVGLSWDQRQLLQAITRELTRARGKARSGRPDKAEIAIGGQATDGVAACPFLEKHGRFVGFNGNGGRQRAHLHGRGYKPLVWMRKAAYGCPEEGQPVWPQVRRFLWDFSRLAELFGLVVGAWHPRECAWRSLAELAPLTRSSAGRVWLRGCLLRVYTGEDFLIRWRRWFASRMGFSVIPDTVREQTVEQGSPAASREAFLAYLSQKGVSPAELARRLGLSRSPVSRHLSGQRGWTKSWQKRIEKWVAGEEGEQSKVATHSL